MPLAPKVEYIQEFIVSGFQVRTTNEDESNEKEAKIPQLWQQFHSHILKYNEPIFGVYSDYESDTQGAYTVTAGSINPELALKPKRVTIQSGKYLVFHGQGDMPLAVINAWHEVWEYFSSAQKYQRRFNTDFEQYQDNKIALYIGIKE